MPKLEIVTGNHARRQFEIRKPQLWIGSDESCEVKLSEPGISRFHAQILTDSTGRVWIQDAGGSFGTRLNQREIEREQLFEGDEITLGRVKMIFREEGAPYLPTPPRHPSKQARPITPMISLMQPFEDPLSAAQAPATAQASATAQAPATAQASATAQAPAAAQASVLHPFAQVASQPLPSILTENPLFTAPSTKTLELTLDTHLANLAPSAPQTLPSLPAVSQPPTHATPQTPPPIGTQASITQPAESDEKTHPASSASLSTVLPHSSAPVMLPPPVQPSESSSSPLSLLSNPSSTRETSVRDTITLPLDESDLDEESPSDATTAEGKLPTPDPVQAVEKAWEEEQAFLGLSNPSFATHANLSAPIEIAQKPAPNLAATLPMSLPYHAHNEDNHTNNENENEEDENEGDESHSSIVGETAFDIPAVFSPAPLHKILPQKREDSPFSEPDPNEESPPPPPPSLPKELHRVARQLAAPSPQSRHELSFTAPSSPAQAWDHEIARLRTLLKTRDEEHNRLQERLRLQARRQEEMAQSILQSHQEENTRLQRQIDTLALLGREMMRYQQQNTLLSEENQNLREEYQRLHNEHQRLHHEHQQLLQEQQRLRDEQQHGSPLPRKQHHLP